MAEESVEREDLELLCFIVNDDMGSEAIQVGKKNGCSGGTVFYGRGTINDFRLKFLGLDNIRKEIVFMVTGETQSDNIRKKVAEKLHLERPNRGIAFSIPLKNVLGRRNSTYDSNAQIREDENVMHQAIFVIIDRGQAEDVIDAAVAAGAEGGTIINARGSGIHENSRVFGMDIEPEKEIILILAENEKVDPIVASISHELQIEQPGKGILFTTDAKNAIGLY